MNQPNIKVILISFFLLMSLTAEAGNDFDEHRPDGINDQKWSGLKSAVQQAKLLPSPAGVGGEDSHFGHSVSVDGNRALVGAPEMIDNGLVFVFEFDGSVWHETAQLKAIDGISGDGFGDSVSLSGDRALIGTPYDDVTRYNSGSAYVFDFNGSVWHQTAKLIPNELTIDFGSVVSLSGDRALITATDDGSSDYFGAVFVFDFNGSVWSETTKLVASDAVRYDYFGRSHSLDGHRALIGAPGVSDSGSVYVFDFNVNNSNWSETAKFTADDVDTSDNFGNSVSLSGSRALIGSYKSNGASNVSGSAYVFDFNGVTWIQTAKLVGSDGSVSDYFGQSVSLSGNRALIGAHNNDGAASGSGSAYVFDFNGSSWNETTKLIAGDGEGYKFGFSVSLSGNRALVGAPDDANFNYGSTYIYEFNGSFWVETAKLTAGDGASLDYFGHPVSLFGDRALIAATRDNDAGANSGSVYVFDFNGTSWSETAKLTASDGAFYDRFGSSVSLFADRALIGARGVGGPSNLYGAAYIFDFNGLQWNETAKLTASVAATDHLFGTSVSLFGDRALIGASGDGDMGTDSGAVYVYDFNGSSWIETVKLTASDGADYASFGSSVNLSGNRALIGAYGDDDAGGNTGSAYIFDFNGTVWEESAKLSASDQAGGDYFGISVSLSGNRALIGSYRDDDLGTNSGSAYVFDYDGSFWSETAKLTARDGAEYSSFGSQVSLSGNRALIGSPYANGAAIDSGSAYVFDFNGSLWDQTMKITANDGAELDYFGGSVSLSGDYALIGSSADDDHGTNSGSAYVFIVNDLIFSDGFDEP